MTDTSSRLVYISSRPARSNSKAISRDRMFDLCTTEQKHIHLRMHLHNLKARGHQPLPRWPSNQVLKLQGVQIT